MTTTPMQFILTIILAFVVCCNCQSIDSGVSSSWAKLQISPDTLSFMEYGNFLIDIYEHANNHKATTTASQKKYFYSPLALLDHKSAVSVYNNVTNQPEMRFRVEMWNAKVQNEVVKHLNKSIGQEIQSDKVRVIPLEKVILTSNIPTADYSLSPVWTNYDRSTTLRLSLSCSEQKMCNKLANEMRSNPEQFDHFKLLYSLSSQTSQTKQTTISIDSVTSGQLVSTLLQKFGDKKEIFLTANDEKKMLAETVTNIRMDTFDDSEVVSPDTESQILNILNDLLVTSRATIKEHSDKKWDSVFWNEDNYRPDKTTKTLNEIIKKLDTETQRKLVEMFQKAERQFATDNSNTDNSDQENERKENAKKNSDEYDREMENKERIQHNYDSNSWANVDRISLTISGKMANKFDNSRRIEIVKEDVEKLLQESRNHVQWDGEKFVPKPMQLSRINLGKFRDSQMFQDRNVRVRYTTAELSAPIKFTENTKLAVSDEWSNLKEELKEMRELFKTAVMNFAKTNTELDNVKSDLINTRINLASKLEGTLVKTKNEMEKTNNNFRKTVDDLLKKLIGTEKELVETKMDVGKFSLELKANSQRFGYQLKTTEDNMRKELRAILNNLETTTTSLASARTELSNTKSAVSDLTTKLNARTNEIVDIGKMPTSCSDLQRMGQKINGFFLVKGSKKLEMIYCDFYPNQNDKQKWIGYADVKSVPVHFYVQRKTSFAKTQTPIPFDLERVNEGNAMNLTSGIFTAPRQGTYYFSFTGLAKFPNASTKAWLGVGLYLNEGQIALGYVEEANTVSNQASPLILHSTLNLRKNDRVWVQITVWSLGAYLLDNNDYTHFTGFMLEEEIVASL